jgi:hypothetical protein
MEVNHAKSTVEVNHAIASFSKDVLVTASFKTRGTQNVPKTLFEKSNPIQ